MLGRDKIDAEVVFINGKAIYLIDAPLVNEEGSEPINVKFGMLGTELQKYGERRQATAIAQFYKLVIPGMVMTRHIFRGLNRPLFCDDNMSGDQEKLVYTRKPSLDYEWHGGKMGRTVERPIPLGRVFAVIVSPNVRHKDNFPEIAGWIERWNWLEEDLGLPEAPIDWVDRYGQKIYTRRWL